VTRQPQGPGSDPLDALERAIVAQRKALVDGQIDELAMAGETLARALAALTALRSGRLTAAQSGRLRRLRATVTANGEFLTRTSSADQRRLEALLGPRTTYGAPVAPSSGSTGARRLGTA